MARQVSRLLSIAIITLCATSALAQRQERIVSSWKPIHYDVQISFNEQLSELNSARTEITLQVLKAGLTVVDLDFGDLPIDSVTVSGEPARFERAPDRLNVTLPHAGVRNERLKILVAYHGKPRDGLILATDRDGRPSATGDNWPNRVHHWIPCLDHPSAKATVSFTIAALPREIVVANGGLVMMTSNGAAPAVWRYEESKPIPAYCMVIAVNEGMKLDGESAVTPLSFYVPRRDRQYAPQGFSAAAPSLAFFNETIGPYPYEKLALIVGATKFGGMENSSAIVFTNNLFDLRPGEKTSVRFGVPTRIESVVAHEIAHQWFGDSVTESTWADLWLSEGFATYFAGLFIEKHEGEEAFRAYMRDAADRYFAYEKTRNVPIHDTETPDLMRLLNPNNYEKGAWVLHMLRSQLGDQAFLRGVRAYYAAHRDANASSEDLREALEKEARASLKDFFARWIYGSGHPQYKLVWDWRGRGTLTLSLEQTQDGNPFLNPVPLEVVTANGSIKQTITPTGKLTTVRIPLKSIPTDVKLDPDETLLKEATVARASGP